MITPAPRISHMKRGQAGFTLVEMIIAVGLFAIVMVVCISALLSLVDANRKAQALQSVMNNLNIAVDGMVRAVREGGNYRCGSAHPSDPNCPSGSSTFYFTPNCSNSCPDWIYVFDTNGTYCGVNTLCRSVDNGVTYFALTAPEITINSVTFYVIGAGQAGGNNILQPKVVMVIKGTAAAAKNKTKATFHIQSTAVQRVLDI